MSAKVIRRWRVLGAFRALGKAAGHFCDRTRPFDVGMQAEDEMV